MATITLLGPQQDQPILKDVLDEQGIEGPLAVITCGWEEREEEQDELEQHVKRKTTNLRLYARWEQVFNEDNALRQALEDRNDRLRTIQTLYRRRLDPALQAVWELHDLTMARMELLLAERSDALRAVAQLDAHYLQQIRSVHTAFEDVWCPSERPAVAAVRDALREQIRGAKAVLIAGGDVGVLSDRLRLFDLPSLLPGRPVIGWSAGAMALTERIILFHDSPPYGRGNPEVYDDGLALCPNVIALPHATTRLRLNDRTRVSIFAGRFKPATCVALDKGSGLVWDGSSFRAIGRARRLDAARGKLIGMAAPQ
ncbi:MAG: Type 1 glutamine amidotransferase-like domain-containing protein [Planctomycetota bacterium]